MVRVSFGNHGRYGAKADTLKAHYHAAVTDLADKVGIAEYAPYRVLDERAVFGSEIS